ncbi:MAG: protein arginine kinase [Verrucomicrobiales bacterium]
MNFVDILEHRREPQPAGIVVSSRVRLARNLTGKPFPLWANKAQRIEILQRLKPEVAHLSSMTDPLVVDMQELTPLQKQVLVERHLISREQQQKGSGSGVAINDELSLSIMINEEDHLRLQGIRPGLDLEGAFSLVNKADDELEDLVQVAFDMELGYLTACPTNVGTGMRASAMLHLPGLVLVDRMNQVVQSVNKLGLVVRGIYGEGTEAMGNLFQISNQTTLGESEEEILARLRKVIDMVLHHENNARETLVDVKPAMLQDQIGRAFGILKHAHSLASKEALNLLSSLKLAVDLGLFPRETRLLFEDLVTDTQPAHLQFYQPKKLSADQRDRLRADLVREKFESLQAPDTQTLKAKNSEDQPEES